MNNDVEMIQQFDFPSYLKDVVELYLPSGSQILTVGTRLGEHKIWVRCKHPTPPPELYRFHVYMTWDVINTVSEEKYICTYEFDHGYVNHVFQVLN